MSLVSDAYGSVSSEESEEQEPHPVEPPVQKRVREGDTSEEPAPKKAKQGKVEEGTAPIPRVNS
jgi:hypothetical protein